MPLYDGECLTCGVVEILKGMNDPWPEKCPQCKGNGFTRIFCTAVSFHKPSDANWEQENNGLGHYCPQLGPRFLDAYTKKQPNPAAYAKSNADAYDKFLRRGYDKSNISKY
jgi:putative FmdB family regulatory protein